MKPLREDQTKSVHVLRYKHCCKDKKRYKTQEEAKNFAEWDAEAFGLMTNQDTYLCPFCHGWHLSTMSNEDTSWLIKQRKKKIFSRRKIKKPKWNFFVQNICIDVPSDEDKVVLVPYGEMFEID